jgi:hypothetical protein
MSEYTNYYALKKIPYDDVKNKLKHLGVFAVIGDYPSDNQLPDPTWITVEIAQDSSSGFEIERLSSEFKKVVELWIDEDYISWTITCCLNGIKKIYDFTGSTTVLVEEDKRYLAELFDLSINIIQPYLAKGKVEQFCDAIHMPCYIMSDQQLLSANDLSKYGGVVLASEISD